jgi:hypothetical protein
MTEHHALTDPTTVTGNARVDRVLAALQGLDEQPVDGHVAMFERAHEELRQALSDAGDRD